MIRVERLSKRYGNALALREVSFSVERGEVFCLLGPNGAGKTTLLSILATLVKPSAGEAYINGISIRDAKAVRSRIGVVFQDQSLDLKLTAWENLETIGVLYGLRGERLAHRIAQVLELLGASEVANTLVKNLSGGMRRRVEVARALLHEPEVLILDEPTLGLDPKVKEELWDHLLRLRRRDATVLLSTNDLEIAEACDRIAIMDRGSVVAIGSAAQLKARIAGEVVRITTRAPEEALEKLRELDIHSPRVLREKLAFIAKDAEELVPRIAKLLGELALAIEVRRPTLADVFLFSTGREIEGDKGKGRKKRGRRRR
jgi:ABC-2 type transport system ATP-binding protein